MTLVRQLSKDLKTITNHIGKVATEAAIEIERLDNVRIKLNTENQKLREALRPFALGRNAITLTDDDYRKAAEVLKK